MLRMLIYMTRKASRGFEPRSLDSESRVLTVTPRGQVPSLLILATAILSGGGKEAKPNSQGCDLGKHGNGGLRGGRRGPI